MDGRYYRGPVEWVTNPFDALTFRNIVEAEKFSQMHGLQHLQLIQQTGYFPRLLSYARKTDLPAHDDETSSVRSSAN